MGQPHITVCICTYQRPPLLQRLLEALVSQTTSDRFTFGIVVCDNDAEKSAEVVVAELARSSGNEIVYCSEPEKNIALARNKALQNATGDLVAFIDDDEFPAPDWLAQLYSACDHYQASGVLGPVRPHFDQPPPAWIVRGRFCERPEHPTGRLMKWDECRTGNLLFRRSILNGMERPFDPRFGTGGEDKDFFMRLTERGRVFIWCSEAVAYETVPPSRWSRAYLLKRALWRGGNILKHPVGRFRMLAQSVVAVPIYSLALPALLLFGQHWFMRYCIKLCDHVGRLLAFVGIIPIREHQL